MKHQKQNTRADRVGQVQVTFTSKPMTAWGGLCAVVGKFLEQIRFREWVLQHMPVRETSPNAKGVYEKVLALLLTSLTGGTRFSHLGWWGHGLEAVKACFGVEWLPQAASVLTRFFGKFRQGHNEVLREAGMALTGRLIQAEEIEEDDLILDSTVCERYGKQEGARRGYNPRKPGRPSHHPLKAVLGRGYVVNLWNRCGDTHTGNRAVEFYEQARRGLPKGLRIRRVLMDCGFVDEKLLDCLEREGTVYTGAMRMTANVISRIMEVTAWRGIAEGVEVADTRVQLSGWDRERRLVLIRQHVPTRPEATGKQLWLFKEMEAYQDYRYVALVTNEESLAPEEVWRNYRARPQVENTIKDLKHGYGWDEFNVQSFWGTEAVMLWLGMIAYNLVHYLNRCVLKIVPEGAARLKTVRLKVLAIPALYGWGAGRARLRMGVKNRGLRGRIRYWLRQINELPLRLFNCNAIAAGGP